MGVVVRRYIDILTIIIFSPVLALFLAAVLYRRIMDENFNFRNKHITLCLWVRVRPGRQVTPRPRIDAPRPRSRVHSSDAQVITFSYCY